VIIEPIVTGIRVLPFIINYKPFDNTPNIGTIDISNNNSFEIKLLTQNSYMIGLGSKNSTHVIY
jgi:hypothetical protein